MQPGAADPGGTCGRSKRHRGGHEVFHVARIVTTWSDEHAHAIAELAPAYGAHLGVRPDGDGMDAGTADPGLLLPGDLRSIY